MPGAFPEEQKVPDLNQVRESLSSPVALDKPEQDSTPEFAKTKLSKTVQGESTEIHVSSEIENAQKSLQSPDELGDALMVASDALKAASVALKSAGAGAPASTPLPTAWFATAANIPPPPRKFVYL